MRGQDSPGVSGAVAALKPSKLLLHLYLRSSARRVLNGLESGGYTTAPRISLWTVRPPLDSVQLVYNFTRVHGSDNKCYMGLQTNL